MPELEARVRAALALLAARHGGRSVRAREIVEWAADRGIAMRDALDALDRLVAQGVAYADAEGWRLVPARVSPRPVEAYAPASRLRLS